MSFHHGIERERNSPHLIEFSVIPVFHNDSRFLSLKERNSRVNNSIFRTLSQSGMLSQKEKGILRRPAFSWDQLALRKTDHNGSCGSFPLTLFYS